MKRTSLRVFSQRLVKALLGTTLLCCLPLSGMAQSKKGGPNVSIQASDFVRVAGPNQMAADCNGAGSTVQSAVFFNNGSAAPVTVAATVTFATGLLALPGSCVVTGGGTCSVVNASTVSYSNPALGAGLSASISFQGQIGDAVPAGTSLCLAISATFDGTPLTANACFTTDCPAVGPGLLPTGLIPPSDQKAGSVLIYNLYTSSTTAPGAQNTRFNITNVEPNRGVAVHLFFVDGGTCSIADRYICLTPSQTMTFLASEQDPGTTGYVVAIASDFVLGCPINFNHLIGDAYVKFNTGHEANLGAEAISAVAGGLPFCNPNSITADVRFDGISYGLMPRVLASSSIPARADGNDTLLVLNRIAGNLGIGAATLGTLFGILYDDAEQSHSFQVTGSCQLRFSLSNTIPRTSPRFEVVIPAGQSGWLKVYNPADIGILGAQINFNPNAGASSGAFSQGRNLHKLKLTSSASYTIPIFPPNC